MIKFSESDARMESVTECEDESIIATPPLLIFAVKFSPVEKTYSELSDTESA